MGELPAYARFIDDRRGGLRLFFVSLMLRRLVRSRIRADMDIARMREFEERIASRITSVDREARRTPLEPGAFAAEWIDVPETRPDRVLLYFHGGAFLFRVPVTHAALLARWCRPLAARALMVDYRLAPEHPFPAAADDCHAAYRWLLAQGIESRQIVIGGDSAGANLALVTLQRIKAAGEPQPACAVLLSPFVDFTLSSPSLVENAGEDAMLSLGAAVGLRALYVDPRRYLDPLVSPVFADFAGLPPLLLQVGSKEMLRDDALRTAARAHACGVPVQLEIWRAMPHVFQALHMLPQADAAIASIVSFVRARAAWPPSA
jgi:acetyl esterase/lipase